MLLPDETFKLTSVTNLGRKIVTFVWYSNDMFHYVFKVEFVTLVGLKVPSGSSINNKFRINIVTFMWYCNGITHRRF